MGFVAIAMAPAIDLDGANSLDSLEAVSPAPGCGNNMNEYDRHALSNIRVANR